MVVTKKQEKATQLLLSQEKNDANNRISMQPFRVA